MNPPPALHGAMGREKKPFSYLPGGLDLSQIKSERMAQRLMRNAMNQGVPEVSVQPIQSPLTPSTPVAVPNFSCLPVQVLPAGFTLPANPKSLLRSRSNPNREAQKAPQSPQFMNPHPISHARIEQLLNDVNKTSPQIPQTNTYNIRPASMFEYGYSPSNNTTRTSYGSDRHTSLVLPEMCYEAEYLTTAPNSTDIKESIESLIPGHGQQIIQQIKPVDSVKTELASILLDTNANVTSGDPVHINICSNNSNDETPAFTDISNSATELNIKPIAFDNKSEVNKSMTLQDENALPVKVGENVSVDISENKKSNFIVTVPDTDVNKMVNGLLEKKPAEDLSDSSDDQKQVKVVKKQVKKENKVEQSATNVEEQNGNQNGDNEAELVVKLPAKKSGTKVETKVEVMKKCLPDGSVEETTKTTTKTTTDGNTSIKTKTETRIIPKEEISEEEVEEQDAEEEVEEPESEVVKQNGHKEITVHKEESTVTTSSEKVVVVESNDQEEEEEEEKEEEEKVVEPVKETEVVVKPTEKAEAKEVEAKKIEKAEEPVVVKKTVAAPEVKPEKEEDQEDEEEEEEEEEQEVVVKKAAPIEIRSAAYTEKAEEEVDEEEEYEEAEEEVKSSVKNPESKPNPTPESKPKEEDEESEYTEEEIESEQDEAPKPAFVEKQEAKPEPKPEPKEDKPETKEEKREEPSQAVPQAESKVPLREPSIPLEKVEDVEIKPIGEPLTVSKTHTENTEFFRNTTTCTGPLSTQTEYNRVENIVTVNRTTKTLDKTYEQITQSGAPTMKTYFAPNRERVSTSPQPAKPYQPAYTPETPKQERRHSLLLERLSTERQMPGSEVYQNSYSNQYSNQSINQSYEQQKQWPQEPQSEVVNVSNVKPSTISNSQWYQQSRNENILYNNVTPTTAPPASQLWNQQQPQTQPQYQPSYTQSAQDYSKVSNAYQQNSYPSYTPQPSSWSNNNLSSVDTIPSINHSYLTHDTQSYQKSSQQYSSYVPPPWEQDPNYVAPATASFYQPRTDVPQPPPASNTFSPNTHPGWTPTLPKTKFSKTPPKAYVPPAPNQSFVKNVNVAVPHSQPGRKTYYSEYERRYITVPESNYVPAENKFQVQPDPSPQYYYDNNEQPAEAAEPQWRKELREFTEKTSQTQQTSVNPPWESEPNYAKSSAVNYTPTPSWSQTLRPQSWRERSFESELVTESQKWAKSNTLGRNMPLSSYAKSAEAPAAERPRGVSVDRFNPNNYSGPILSEHQPVQGQTLTPANAPHSKGYHNPNVPAYHARPSAEPREQSNYHHPRTYGLDSRASPLQSRSFKYLQWITGTEE